ncbi:MAG: IS4 family transposase [Tepidiformaceae bacterium]
MFCGGLVSMADAHRLWAETEFGRAGLGDVRRVRRLVRLAAAAARKPDGCLPAVLEGAADREAGFRFVENEDVPVAAIANASHAATARRCVKEAQVIVPVDGSSLTMPSDRRLRGFGAVGARRYKRQGVQVMSALALTEGGVPLGLLAQDVWVRGRKATAPRKGRGSKHDRRPREARESYAWVRVLRTAVEHLGTHAPATTPWFQMDRGADCLSVLAHAHDAGLRVTVRACRERRLRWPDGREGYLFDAIATQPVVGSYELAVPARPDQVARRAVLDIRFTRLPLLLRVSKKKRRVVETQVLLAIERHPPVGQTPLRWMLFTTHPVATIADALQILAAYALRWRIEDFHKTWKSGACRIEESRLQALDHLLRWATIMAAVAARIERIKHLSRQTPDVPATVEYSRDEIDATLLLYKPTLTKIHIPYNLGDTPTVGEVTRWIASLGGYMGSRNSPPPGTIVLRRGLERIQAAATALAALREQRSG